MSWLFPTRDETVAKLRAALDAEELERAAELAHKAMRKWPDDPEVFELAGWVAAELEAPDEAVAAFGRAATLDPESIGALLGRASAWLDLADPARALDDARAAVDLDKDDAEAHYVLATALELAGRLREADREYERAERLDPDAFPRPFRVSRHTFDHLMRRAIERLPPHVHDAIDNLSMGVKDHPGPEDQIEGEKPLSLQLLGVFQGASLRERTTEDPWTTAGPGIILLFQKNLERACRSREELEEQILITVFHEVGHYLGMDEDEIHGRGLG
ncbi:MAG: hypothetical protein AMXMBFR64_56010 [Myxococcales bacterium]